MSNQTILNPQADDTMVWVDYKASWVAVFILLLIWWLSYVPLFFNSKYESRSERLDIIQTAATEKSDDDYQGLKVINSMMHFRDGLAFLLTAVILNFSLAAPASTCNTLSWIFTGIWLILGVIQYFWNWRRPIILLQFLDLILLVALISNAFANSNPNAMV